MALEIRYTYHHGTIPHYSSWQSVPEGVTAQSATVDAVTAVAAEAGKLFGPGQVLVAMDEDGEDVRIINGPTIDFITFDLREV